MSVKKETKENIIHLCDFCKNKKESDETCIICKKDFCLKHAKNNGEVIFIPMESTDGFYFLEDCYERIINLSIEEYSRIFVCKKCSSNPDIIKLKNAIKTANTNSNKIEEKYVLSIQTEAKKLHKVVENLLDKNKPISHGK